MKRSQHTHWPGGSARRLAAVLALWLALFAGGSPGIVGAAEAEAPRFSRHVVPLFSRLGCNAGTCHGAGQGQNGFRLSLFGADPAQDHRTLLAEFGGRRLNRYQPDDSLLLLKAVGKVPHQGGRRTTPDSPDFRLMRDWIVGGAVLDELEHSRVTRLQVTPQQRTLKLGETARTPKINKDAGRDHWGTGQSVLVAGGGFKGETVVGATDKNAAYVVERYYKVERFGRTIYHLLGIDPDQTMQTLDGRPLRLIVEEAPLIREALA